MQITTSYGSSAAHRCRGPAQTFPPFFSLHSVLRCWDISLSILTCFPVWGWTVLSVYLHTRRYLPWVSFTGWRWAERKSKLWRKCRLPLQGTIFKTKIKICTFPSARDSPPAHFPFPRLRTGSNPFSQYYYFTCSVFSFLFSYSICWLNICPVNLPLLLK